MAGGGIGTIENMLIVVIWHLFAHGEGFKELGPDFHAQRHELRSKIKAGKELERLGYDLQLVPSEA